MSILANKAFLENRKHLFKLAVNELNQRKAEAEQRRDWIYQRECEIFQEKSAEMKNLRLKMMF